MKEPAKVYPQRSDKKSLQKAGFNKHPYRNS